MSVLQAFAKRHPNLGPIFWIASIQYYIVQVFVGLDWHNPSYNIGKNTISDLGNTKCAEYGSRFVCSPRHALMNLSFIVLGLTMIAGASLIYQSFKKGRAIKTYFVFMGLGGVGTIIVGLFPENTVSAMHVFGASLPFILGNIGMILLSVSEQIPRRLRYFSLTVGTIAVVALILFVTSHYFGLGSGGMERIAAYPQTIWLIGLGIYLYERPKRQ